VIRLHRTNVFQPDSNSACIPLLQLNDLFLVEMRAGDQVLRLAVDTGFSGSILLNEESAQGLAESLTMLGKASAAYRGIHSEYAGEQAILEGIQLKAQQWPGLSQRDIQLEMIDCVVMSGFNEETAFGQLDGILGSGFL